MKVLIYLRVFATLMTGISVAGHGAAQDGPREATVELPKIVVSGGVPLLKTAGYHLLTARAAAASVVHGRYIFVIGGLGKNKELLRSIERFDTVTGRSEHFAELRVARMWHRAVVVGDRVYILGGQNFVPDSSADDPFGKDPPSTRILDESAEREADYRARMNEAMSPRTESEPRERKVMAFVGTVEVLDLKTGKVEKTGDMPNPRAEFGCVVVGSDIYAIGGKYFVRKKLAFTNRTIILDTISNKWRDGVSMPITAVVDATVVTGPFIIVAGGYTGSKKLDAVFTLNPQGNIWRGAPPLTRATSAQSTVFLDKYLFLFGDYDSPEEILVYNLQSKTSAIFTLQYIPARHAAAVSCEGKIYVIGGKQHRYSEPIDNIQQFELTKNLPMERR